MPSRKVKEPSAQYKTTSKAPFDIKERTFLFGVRVVKLVGQLPRNVAGIEVGKQLVRAGTSVGANVEEAQSGESKRDFVHKIGIAAKEAREARYWLRIVKATLLQTPRWMRLFKRPTSSSASSRPSSRKANAPFDHW
jgi:four helix bundle protein